MSSNPVQRRGPTFKGSADQTKSVTELVNPRQFLQQWNVEALESVYIKPAMTDAEINHRIAQKMGMTDDTAHDLATVCGKEALMCGMEPKSRLTMLEMKSAPEPAEATLESLRLQINARHTRTVNDSLRGAVSRRMKYNVMDEHMTVVPLDVRKLVECAEHQVPLPNVILTVQICRCLHQGESAARIKESETFNVLASQPLTALRDKIRCSSDAIIAGDYSSMPDVDPNSLQKAGDLYKSSYFFIENVFYNDHRLPDNKDYSKQIIEWAEEEGPTYTTAQMEDITFNDLSFRLGQFYLFVHQGNCEHAVVFSDMRMFMSEDVQDIHQFPQMTISRVKKRSVCQGCSKLSAKWIVQGAPILPSDPCYLCKLCFKTLLYDKDGQKLSTFKAFLLSDFYTGS